jgi:hypothetical protein
MQPKLSRHGNRHRELRGNGISIAKCYPTVIIEALPMQGYTLLIKKGEILNKTMTRKVGKRPSHKNIQTLSGMVGLTPAYIYQAIKVYLLSRKRSG